MFKLHSSYPPLLAIVLTASSLQAQQKCFTDSQASFISPHINASMANARLELGVRVGDLSEVKIALEQGADINFRNQDGQTPFMFAIQNVHSEVLGFLFNQGADIYARDNAGKSALDYARDRRVRAMFHVHILENLTNSYEQDTVATNSPLQANNPSPTPSDITLENVSSASTTSDDSLATQAYSETESLHSSSLASHPIFKADHQEFLPLDTQAQESELDWIDQACSRF